MSGLVADSLHAVSAISPRVMPAADFQWTIRFMFRPLHSWGESHSQAMQGLRFRRTAPTSQVCPAIAVPWYARIASSCGATGHRRNVTLAVTPPVGAHCTASVICIRNLTRGGGALVRQETVCDASRAIAECKSSHENSPCVTSY